MLINIPNGGPTTLVDASSDRGRTYHAEEIDGRPVFDIPANIFLNLVRGPNGLGWQTANPAACAELSNHRF